MTNHDSQVPPPIAAAPRRRASDAFLADAVALAVADLTALIAEAVKLSDDHLVTRLDAVLRRVESIGDLALGAPTDRAEH